MIESLIHSMIVCPDMDKDYPRLTYGKGVYVYDEKGKAYLDAAAGSAAVVNLGYGLAEIADVMRDQAQKISVQPAHAFSSPVLENYLKKLTNFAPAGFSRSWLTMSGTEAVENAIKLAYQYHQLKGNPSRFKVIGRWKSYHGNSIFTLDIGGMKSRRQTYNRWMNNFPHIPAAYSYRRPTNQPLAEYSRECSDALEKCILEEGPDSIAALVIEPVVAAALGAVLPPDEEYLKELRRICTKYDIVMIADEVLTGFGRLGQNFGMNVWSVEPDIIAAGKGISGGYYPLSAIIANTKITKVLEDTKTPFLGGHTFACNPLGAAVGSFVIDYLLENNILHRVNQVGKYLLNKLQRLDKYDIVGDVRGVGMMFGIEFVKNKNTKEPFPASMRVSKVLGDMAIERGVILYPGQGSVDGLNGDHILITPPLILNECDADVIVDTLEECIKNINLK
ncbi:L-Lysine-8-amino-7-oxononanoate aminotransferase [compost metagenome]